MRFYSLAVGSIAIPSLCLSSGILPFNPVSCMHVVDSLEGDPLQDFHGSLFLSQCALAAMVFPEFLLVSSALGSWPLCGLEAHKAVCWGSPRTHFICFPFLRDCCLFLPNVYSPGNHVSQICLGFSCFAQVGKLVLVPSFLVEIKSSLQVSSFLLSFFFQVKLHTSNLPFKNFNHLMCTIQWLFVIIWHCLGTQPSLVCYLPQQSILFHY